MTEFDQNQADSNQSMEDAMKSVQEVSVGDVVKGEVLAIEDKQVIVGIEGAGVEGVVPAKELSKLFIIKTPFRCKKSLGRHRKRLPSW